jgi:hypothetical protein
MEEQNIVKCNFPRILMVLPSYSINDGGSITINNLFGQWPVDRIAICSPNLNIDHEVKWNNFYQLGSLEEKSIFPINLFNKRKKYSGIVKPDYIINDISFTYTKKNVKHQLSQLARKKISLALSFLGLTAITSKQLVISKEYLSWVTEFKPDILYVCPLGFELAKFMLNLHDKIDIPMVIHIMDDYQKKSQKGLCYYCLERQNNITYKKLIENSKLHLCVSDGMAEAYLSRVKRKFYTFHNPVDIVKMNVYRSEAKKSRKKFRILQVGNISFWRIKSILNICDAITSLNINNNTNISLDIFAQNIKANSPLRKLFSKYEAVSLNAPLKHEEVLKIISSYDLVLLAANFDRKVLKYLHLSYSTNTSELMASGTTILIYAPEKIKFVSSAKAEQWAYTITEENIENLKMNILMLINDPILRESIARNAMKLANENDEINMVQSNLKTLFRNIIGTASIDNKKN